MLVTHEEFRTIFIRDQKFKHLQLKKLQCSGTDSTYYNNRYSLGFLGHFLPLKGTNLADFTKYYYGNT